jgi:hypothetical protein
MNSQDRRRFLKVLGMGAVGAAVVERGAIARLVEEPVVPGAGMERLRSSLLERRSGVSSLRLRWSAEATGGSDVVEEGIWPPAGRSLVLLSGGRQRLEHHRRDGTVIEVANHRRYLREVVDRHGARNLVYRGPLAANRRPLVNLDTFLPVLGDAPAYDLGRETVDGQSVQGVGQGYESFLVALKGPVVVRRDVFSSAGGPKERIHYGRFVRTAGVDFPTHLRWVRFDGGGKEERVVELFIDDLEINPPVADDLFAIEGIYRHSWTARGAYEALPATA